MPSFSCQTTCLSSSRRRLKADLLVLGEEELGVLQPGPDHAGVAFADGRQVLLDAVGGAEEHRRQGAVGLFHGEGELVLAQDLHDHGLGQHQVGWVEFAGQHKGLFI